MLEPLRSVVKKNWLGDEPSKSACAERSKNGDVLNKKSGNGNAGFGSKKRNSNNDSMPFQTPCVGQQS